MYMCLYVCIFPENKGLVYPPKTEKKYVVETGSCWEIGAHQASVYAIKRSWFGDWWRHLGNNASCQAKSPLGYSCHVWWNNCSAFLEPKQQFLLSHLCCMMVQDSRNCMAWGKYSIRLDWVCIMIYRLGLKQSKSQLVEAILGVPKSLLSFIIAPPIEPEWPFWCRWLLN